MCSVLGFRVVLCVVAALSPRRHLPCKPESVTDGMWEIFDQDEAWN